MKDDYIEALANIIFLDPTHCPSTDQQIHGLEESCGEILKGLELSDEEIVKTPKYQELLKINKDLSNRNNEIIEFTYSKDVKIKNSIEELLKAIDYYPTRPR